MTPQPGGVTYAVRPRPAPGAVLPPEAAPHDAVATPFATTARTEARGGLYGLFRIGGALFALDIAAIREVTPRPADLVPFPALREDIVGAIDLRGAVIPVMDPAAVFGVPLAQGRVILVVRAGGGVFGMFIDEICDVAALPAGALSPLATGPRQDGAPQLVVAGFVHRTWRGVLLDPDAMARLPGLAVTADHAVDRTHNTDIGDPVLLFDCAGTPLGLPATVVDATVPRTRLTPPAADAPLWIGMLDHNGRRIPVIDTLGALGVGEPHFHRPGRPLECASVVLRMADRRLVALAIDRVCDMRRVREAEIQPLQRFRVGQPGLLRGLYQADRAHLLIEADALAADTRLIALAQIEERSAAASSGGTATKAAAKVEPFLIVALGQQCCAVPLAQVDEIVPTPEEHIALDDGGVLIAHRGRGVPLIDLAARLGLPGPGTVEGGYIIMASDEDDRMGFRVETLVAVERVALQPLASPRAGSRVPAATVRIGDGRTCEVIDLAAIIAMTRSYRDIVF